MPDRKRQLKDAAASALRKGKYEKALDLYQHVANLDPDDYSARRNVGYIFRKMGRIQEAIDTFIGLANEYAADGFMLKAIATCKVVLEIDPNHTEIQEQLAELYSNQTKTPTPALKVMADPHEHNTTASVQQMPPHSKGLSSDAIELPVGDQDEFQITRGTADTESTSTAPFLQEASTPKEGPPALIEMFELQPIPLEPVEVLQDQQDGQTTSAEKPSFDLQPVSAEELDLEGSSEPQAEALGSQHPASTPISQLFAKTQEPNSQDKQQFERSNVRAETIDLDQITESRIAHEPAETPSKTSAEIGQQASVESAPANASAADPIDDFEIDIDFDVEPETTKTKCKAPEIPLFCELEPKAFITLLERMGMIRMTPGQWILREGEPGSSMFTIASGKVRVLKRTPPNKLVQLATLGEGTFFGEMCLLRGGLRGASVQALEAGELFEISRELIDLVVEHYPAVQTVLSKFSRQRMLRNAMVTSILFQPFSQKQRIEIIERFVSKEVEKGQRIILEGEESDGLYLVLRGKMDVFCKTDDNQEIPVGQLHEGEIFGEISCLRKEPAIATVRAKTNGSVLRLPRKDFDRLILSHPQILELISALGESRTTITANKLAEKGILI